jgi:preprotein translocase subunit SecA
MPLPRDFTAKSIEGLSSAEIENRLVELATALYDQREKEMGPDKMRLLERLVMLQTIDRLWIEHLTAMEHMRLQAGWAALQQMKSTDAYKSTGYRQFQTLLETIRHDVAHTVFHVSLVQKDAKQPQSPMAKAGVGSQSNKKPKVPAQVSGKKVGRNDPCPCGSGKKYKHCCGR